MEDAAPANIVGFQESMECANLLKVTGVGRNRLR